MERLRVMYDISPLGAALVDQKARTGVFRVVERLAGGLAVSPGIDLSFCCMEKPAECERLVRETPRFAGVPLAADPLALRISRGREALRRQGRGAPLPARIPLKAAAELLKLAGRVLERRTGPIDRALLGRCDIFHTPYLPIPPLVKGAGAVKRFITVYDLIPLLRPDLFPQQGEHPVTRAVASIDRETWVLAISRATKDDLCSCRPDIDPDRVIVTPLAAAENFRPNCDPAEQAGVRAKYGIPEGDYLLSLSTLEPRKNIDHTVRCFARLVEQERLGDLSLVLVGTRGWNYDRIFKEILAKPQIRERIIVTGYADDGDLSAIYSGATAFVYPSFYEGFGLPPLEAMQCGVPVITSNTSSLPEVVGDAGIMVSPTDGDALCQAMLALCRDSELRRELGARALQRARLFSWEACLAATTAAYRRACDR